MSKRSIWILVAVLLVTVLAVTAFIIYSGDDENPTASPTVTESETSVATTTPIPTPSATPDVMPVVVSCDTISTEEFRAMMNESGFVSWETTNQQIGARPFASFPSGEPEGQLVCRWGEGEDIATDNVIDLAWAPMPASDQSSAQNYLVAEGYTLSTTDEGAVYANAVNGDGYLFTTTDVRWAPQVDYLQYTQSPDAAQ
ncbi:hypothetical protein ACWPKO_19605 (plasmid) [Coraliomargarita sp. W4R53]